MVKQCVSLGRTIESKNVIYNWLTGHKGTNESYTLSKAFKKSIAKSWHSYNPYHQVLLNSYTVFELRHPRNYNHPYTQIECPSDFPQRLSYCSDDSSFKTVRYDCSHVNLANRVTAWNRHMAFTNSFVNHAHKYSHYLLQADKAKLIGRHPHCHSRRVKQTSVPRKIDFTLPTSTENAEAWMHHSFASGTDSNTNNAKEQNPPTMSEVRNAPATSNQGGTERSSRPD